MVNVWLAYLTSNMCFWGRKMERSPLSIERYEQMTEDLHDLAIVAYAEG